MQTAMNYLPDLLSYGATLPKRAWSSAGGQCVRMCILRCFCRLKLDRTAVETRRRFIPQIVNKVQKETMMKQV